MYTNINYQLIAAKQQDMLAQGEKDRLARQARQMTRASRPAASRRRRTWKLMQQLLPQAQQ